MFVIWKLIFYSARHLGLMSNECSNRNFSFQFAKILLSVRKMFKKVSKSVNIYKRQRQNKKEPFFNSNSGDPVANEWTMMVSIRACVIEAASDSRSPTVAGSRQKILGNKIFCDHKPTILAKGLYRNVFLDIPSRSRCVLGRRSILYINAVV